MSTSTITLKITADDFDLNGKTIRNAVRRAFADIENDLPESGEVKGVRFSVRRNVSRSKAPKTLTEAGVIRQWARENNVEVGKRGRIHPDVKRAYENSESLNALGIN